MSSTITFGVRSPASSATGIRFADEVANVTTYNAASGTAIAVGDLVMMTLNADTGEYDKGIRHYAATAAYATPDRLYGIALEASSSDTAVIKVQVRGKVLAACEANMDAGAVGAPSLSNTGRLELLAQDPVGSAGTTRTKAIAISMGATVTAGDLTMVLFDGISGFGASTV